MQNSNLTPLATLRNMRGKVHNDFKKTPHLNSERKINRFSIPDHYIVIRPDPSNELAANQGANIPTAIHR